LEAREALAVKRRAFITLVGGAATWPLATRAQQPSKRPVIGFLGTTAPAAISQWTSSFERRLSELGWVPGRTISIEYRWAEAHPERYAEIAAEFVRLPVDIIVTTVPAVPALKAATSVIPIVFTLATDPVGGGLIASLARPGGNVTGLSMQATDLASKRVDLLHEIVPKLSDLAILGNVEIPQVLLEMREVETAAQKFNLKVIRLEVRRAEDFAPAFASLNGRAQALYVCADPLAVLNRMSVHTLASAARLPTMYGIRDDVVAGGLMSYGADFADQFRRAADMTDKILHGVKPGDIPVEQPTKFDFVINLKTARALEIAIPPNLLALADGVIE
jgi:putative tryptophan/tyrosine transport system substrate-binding protein